jgi:hypothetical protein
MQNVSLGKKRFVTTYIVALFVMSVTLSAYPASALANTLLPIQVLPPAAGKSCPPVSTSEVSPHVYGGQLDSFDITVSDAKYVAVATVVNNSPVAYRYLTRWVNTDGTIRTHVDLQPTPVGQGVYITITYMSVQSTNTGSITCIFTVPALIQTEHYMPLNQSSETKHQAQADKPLSVPGDKPTGTVSLATSSVVIKDKINPGIVGAASSLRSLCIDGGAKRLWVVLLILFGLFAFMLSTQKLEGGSVMRDWNIGLILLVFIGLQIFWYASAQCRTGAWAPAFATLIAIAGLLYSMFKPDDKHEILLLNDGKK